MFGLYPQFQDEEILQDEGMLFTPPAQVSQPTNPTGMHQKQNQQMLATMGNTRQDRLGNMQEIRSSYDSRNPKEAGITVADSMNTNSDNPYGLRINTQTGDMGGGFGTMGLPATGLEALEDIEEPTDSKSLWGNGNFDYGSVVKSIGGLFGG